MLAKLIDGRIIEESEGLKKKSGAASGTFVKKELEVLEKEQQHIDAEAALLEKKLRIVMQEGKYALNGRGGEYLLLVSFRKQKSRGDLPEALVQFGEQKECTDSPPDATEPAVSTRICLVRISSYKRRAEPRPCGT